MKFAYRWHGRVGAVLAPLLAVSALSGAALLWLQPLPVPPQAAPTTATLQAWGQVLDQGLAELVGRHPGAQADLVDLPRQPGAPIRVHLRSVQAESTGWTALDTGDGHAAALQPDSRDAHTLLFHLHEQLLLEGPGPWVLRAVAAAGLVAVALGLRIWWRVRKLPARTPWRRWHRRVGVMAALPLLLLLATGFVLRSPEWTRGVLAAVDGPAAPPAGPPAARAVPAAPAAPAALAATAGPAAAIPSGAAGPSPGQLLVAAAAVLPEARPLRLYAARDGVVRVRLRANEWNPYGMHSVYLRAADATVLRVVRPQALPLQARYLDVVYPLHTGWLPGQPPVAAALAWRALWTLLALALAWMAFSGAWPRWRPAPPQRAPAKSRSATQK